MWFECVGHIESDGFILARQREPAGRDAQPRPSCTWKHTPFAGCAGFSKRRRDRQLHAVDARRKGRRGQHGEDRRPADCCPQMPVPDWQTSAPIVELLRTFAGVSHGSLACVPGWLCVPIPSMKQCDAGAHSVWLHRSCQGLDAEPAIEGAALSGIVDRFGRG